MMEPKRNANSFSYRAFVLRVWRDGEQGPWRASLQDAGAGKKVYFATLERLCLFLLSLDEKCDA
jgi:hypothetical protein